MKLGVMAVLLGVLGAGCEVYSTGLDEPVEDEAQAITFALELSDTVSQAPVLLPNLEEGLRVLAREARYPEAALQAGVEGGVVIVFTVGEDGAVERPRVASGIGAGCDEEALAVVRQAHFRPGKKDGHVAPVRMAFIVTFRLPS